MEGRMDQSPGAPLSETSPVNILVVDDQPAKLLSYEVVLAGIGAQLIKASSACEAFECLLKNDIGLILIDVCMPDLDGFELATLIREHPRFQRIAVIFVSAVMQSDLHRLRGYELGALDYIAVPVVPELLRAKVKVFLDLYRKTRQLKQFGAQLEQRVLERTAELNRCHQELEKRVEERTREREWALAQLFQARQRDNLGQLAEVSHDFNNLLMAVLGSLTLLDKHLPDDPTTRRHLRNATQGTLRGTALTRSLLAFSRRRDRKPTSVDIGSVVSGMEELLKHALGFGVELTWQFPGKLPPVLADSHQLELALLAVALDVRDAMSGNGRLTISAWEELHAGGAREPRLPPGRYVRIQIVSVAIAARDPTKPSGASLNTEVDDNTGALSVIRTMLDQSGGALRIERRANAGNSVGLWLPQAAAGRWDHGPRSLLHPSPSSSTAAPKG
jgi:DNA-binding response OmpR family regulator